MATQIESEFQQNVTKIVSPEIEQIRAALRSIESKLDLHTQAARLVLDMSIIGFVDRVLEINLTSVEGKAQEKKGQAFVQ